MKKLLVSCALAGAVFGASTLSAEESGGFIGLDLGLGSIKVKTSPSVYSSDKSGFRYGLMGGYKQFFTESFGLRYYAQINNGEVQAKKFGDDKVKISALNILANVDALYNFVDSGDTSFGIFGGLSVGYVTYTSSKIKSLAGKKAVPSGLDLGINFGLRAVFAKNHGVELFGRAGLIEQEGKVDGTKYKYSQPISFGARYIFNF